MDKNEEKIAANLKKENVIRVGDGGLKSYVIDSF